MIINPNNGNQLFIATNQGIFRTNNATSTNPSWEQVFTGIGDYFDTEFKGLVFQPNNSNNIIASGQDIYKSTDGGNTWFSLTEGTSLDLENMPDPNFSVDRINIAVSPAAPNRVWAYIISERYAYYIYMFDGADWNEKREFIDSLNNHGITVGRPGLAVSPVNADVVYYGYRKLWSTLDGGTNFSQNSGIHDDIQALEYAPNMTTPKLFCGSDGGISLKENNTSSWITRNNGLAVSTLWSFDDTDFDDDIIIAGFQDNYTKRTYLGDWESGYILSGDGYGAQVNDKNPNISFIKNNGSNTVFRYYYDIDDLEAESQYMPLNNSGEQYKLVTDYEIKNHPITNKMYWTFSQIFKRKKDTPVSGDTWEDLWEIVSDIPIENERMWDWRRQLNRFEIAESNPNYRYVIRPGSSSNQFTNPITPMLYRVTG